MRVLMLVSEAPPIRSGIARVAGELTTRLQARGIEIDTLSANEIPRWTFKEIRLSSLALRWPAIQRMLPQYDILHVHGTVPTFSDVGLLFGRLGLPLSRSQAAIVYTHHSDIDIAGLDLPVSAYNRVHRMLLTLADHVVASTPTYASLLEAAAEPGRVSTVGFGVDARRFQRSAGPGKAERFNVLFVGQLRPYKGVDVLLRAWRHVHNADLHIAGDGHQRAELETLARDLGLQSVHFHGSVSEEGLPELYARAHALVLPSNRKAEAFGLVLLEGMAAGCVPISSDLPGVADVVGSSGFTFPVGDSEALGAILVRLRDDVGLRGRMSALATARSIAEDWDYTAGGYYGIYRQAYLGRQLERLMERGGGGDPHKLRKWLEEVARLAEADRASLMLAEPGTRTLRMAAAVGIPTHVASSARLQMGERVAGFVAHTGRSMLVTKRGMHHVARVYLGKRDEFNSSLILPVHNKVERVGVINVARAHGRLPFTEADDAWLSKLAAQAAPILSRYRSRARIWDISPSDGWLPPALPRVTPLPTHLSELPARIAAFQQPDPAEPTLATVTTIYRETSSPAPEPQAVQLASEAGISPSLPIDDEDTGPEYPASRATTVDWFEPA